VQADELVAGKSVPWQARPRWTEQSVIACDANSRDLLWYSLTCDPSGLPHLSDIQNGKKVLETSARAGKVEGRWGLYPWDTMLLLPSVRTDAVRAIRPGATGKTPGHEKRFANI